MFPNVNEDLTGTKPIDWNAVAEVYPNVAKYKVNHDKILVRDEILRNIVHGPSMEQASAPLLEDLCRDLPDEQGNVAVEVRKLAKQYTVLRNKNARLPGFGKWISSMFKDRQDMFAVLARAGQHERIDAGGIVISCNPVDMLRGGLGENFGTCLGPDGYGGWGGVYANVLPAVLEEVSGAAVAFIVDPKKPEFYLARCWIHHILVNGKHAIQMNTPYGNGITTKKLADLIASKGYDVYDQTGWGNNTVKYEFVNNFKRRVHWDAIEIGGRGTLIAAAKPINNVKKKAA